MKYLFNKIIIMSLIFVTMLSPNIYSDENKWGVEIELSKQDYILHEPIWLNIILTNITSNTLRTHGLVEPNHLGFNVKLTDRNGELVKYTGPQWTFGSVPGCLLLKTGEQEYGSFDLSGLFFSHEGKSGYIVDSWRFPYIPKGTYKVQVIFEGDTSNVLTFNIIKPSIPENEVLKLIEKASKIWCKGKTDPSAKIYKEIIDKYPMSDFSEMCYYLSSVYSQNIWDELKQGTYDYRNLHRELLKKYPNSGRSKSWFRSITHEVDDVQKLEILNKFIEDYPNTRCYKFAKQMKDRILKKKE